MKGIIVVGVAIAIVLLVGISWATNAEKRESGHYCCTEVVNAYRCWEIFGELARISRIFQEYGQTGPVGANAPVSPNASRKGDFKKTQNQGLQNVLAWCARRSVRCNPV